jgi:signal transduction histidine kinase
MLSPSVIAPPTPTPIDEIAAAIENIVSMQDLPYEDKLWLARHGTEVVANAGDVLYEEGAPAEHMVMILKGEIHVRRKETGPMALFIGRTGQVTGVLPFSRMKSYGGQAFAITPLWGLLIHRSLFPEMVQSIPSMGQRCVSLLLDRVREVTRMEQQAEKLTALGKLAANLAHELNNPASAAQRASSSLVAALRANRANRFKLVNLCLTEEQILRIEAWEERMISRSAHEQNVELDAVELLRREDSIRAWLSAYPIGEAAEIAPQLAEQCVTPTDLDELRAFLGPVETAVLLQFFARYLNSTRAAEAIFSSTERIFDLIEAIKDYSNMDRAPILEVDVPAGLDATLQMFGSRIDHVEIERHYEPGLPSISAYAGELNQVWTELIENALEAMDYRGRLRLTCRLEADMLLVEIWDTGPGIPLELQERVFEPFFTTKAPGRGLGLGLDHAMRIVRKHRGHLSVLSEPGSTCFRVRLPLDQLQAY